jgi:hypothetical protein
VAAFQQLWGGLLDQLERRGDIEVERRIEFGAGGVQQGPRLRTAEWARYGVRWTGLSVS